MEKQSDLESKYQKLATEYSKVRSQATVLKKAVLDEQAKNSELKDTIKKHEQQIRKHGQEMESLIFRNDQLTKRISVLQTELQVNHTGGKKMKNKGNASDNPGHSNFSVLDEELQKKILENAQLMSSMADKEYELGDCKEKVEWLQGKVASLQRVITDLEEKQSKDAKKFKQHKCCLEKTMNEEHGTSSGEANISDNYNKEVANEINYLEEELKRWKNECELLRCKPAANDKLTEYYENQISDLLESKQLAQSETKSLCAENQALNSRLEQLILENKHLENCLTKSNEELVTTNENYKTQLDAMTEHLAAQNEKITKQCDEIQLLKHRLTQKSK